MIIFALYNFKGGVGKTTSCVNLAYLSSRDGFNTLLWDLDPQSAATFYLDKKDSVNGSLKALIQEKRDLNHYIQPTQYRNLSYIPGHIKNRNLDIQINETENVKKRFKDLKSELKEDYDYVFIDCPPSLSHLANQIFQSAHFILMPVIPTVLSERTFFQVRDHFEENNLDTRKLLPFFTLVDNRKTLHKNTMQSFRENYPKVLRSSIPSSSDIEKMGIHQAPIYVYARLSEGSMSYRNLWQELKWFKKLKPKQLISERRK